MLPCGGGGEGREGVGCHTHVIQCDSPPSPLHSFLCVAASTLTVRIFIYILHSGSQHISHMEASVCITVYTVYVIYIVKVVVYISKLRDCVTRLRFFKGCRSFGITYKAIEYLCTVGRWTLSHNLEPCRALFRQRDLNICLIFSCY